jgi:hypothetical protein
MACQWEKTVGSPLAVILKSEVGVLFVDQRDSHLGP